MTSTRNPITVKSRYRGAILGTAIGDALGAPFECMSKKDIIKQYPVIYQYVDPGKVNRPQSIHQNVRGSGQWTDDTQLMKPILLSITNLGYICPQDIARFSLKVYQEEELRGWGKSTREAVKRLSEGVPWTRAADTSLGYGNGVAMKAAPLGCYLSSMKDHKTFYNTINSIVSVGKITHHEIGITAGVLQSVLIAMSINGIRNKKILIEELARIEESLFGETRFADKLKIAVKLPTIEIIAEQIGTNGKATESWITATAVFLNTKNRRQAFPNLCELIQQGGDTDTIGAMYAALVGARWGAAAFPKLLKRDLEKRRELTRLSDDLFNSVEETIVKQFKVLVA